VFRACAGNGRICRRDDATARHHDAAEKAARRRRPLSPRLLRGRKQYLDGFHISFDNWHSTDSPENPNFRRTFYRQAEGRGLIATKTIEQLLRSRKGMFLPDRYIKASARCAIRKTSTATPARVCSSVYAPTELINPYSTLTGRCAGDEEFGALFFQALRSAMRGLPEGLDRP